MNAKILELFAAQARSGGRPGIAELIAAMAASSSVPQMDSKDLLARLGDNNPAVASLLQHMSAQQRNIRPADAPTVIDVEPGPEVPRAELPAPSLDEPEDALAMELKELRRLNEAMRAEAKLTRERNDLFAAAVGACCLCWGTDLNCRSCRGRGGPGFCIPDEQLFDEYVVPAVRTLRAQKAKIRNLAPGVPPRSTETAGQFKAAANY
jgi:hypothetical protein